MEKEKQAAEKQKGIDALNENLKKIHELANQPMKCSIDEVAAAYFQFLRVENYEILGEEFGGYKIGRIYLFVLDLLSKHIDDTMNARQISRDCMTRETGEWLKRAEQGVERCPIKDSPYYGKTIKEILEGFSKKICNCREYLPEHLKKDKECMYCKENGVINHDVFIEVDDRDLGRGWVCKECFLAAENEKDKRVEEQEAKIEKFEHAFDEIKAILNMFGHATNDKAMVERLEHRLKRIGDIIKTVEEEEK